jgi:hypothetical protein
MMETVYITWTIRNWITIVLMAALGFMLLGLGSQFWMNYKAKNG